MYAKKCITFLYACLVLLGVSFFSDTAKAQGDISPSHVFQISEDIIHQLQRMHHANLSTPNLDKINLDIPDRLPRHVIQQALNLRKKIQILKRINGLEPANLSAPPVRDIAPKDVLEVVTTILDELVEFDTAFQLTPFRENATFVDGKTPTDVYKNLLKAQAMIVQLGMPATVPNDVYNDALAVVHDLNLIRTKLGKTETIDRPSDSIGKTPRDAYSVAFYALKGIKGLSQKDHLKLSKGVIIPKRKKGDIRPTDVQQLLLFCLAELSAIKHKLGITESQILPPAAAGQTPSSVFDELSLVNRQIQSLQW